MQKLQKIRQQLHLWILLPQPLKQMSIKEKKVIIAVSGGVISALRQAYDLIDEHDQLPAIEDYELPRLAPAIMKSLERKLFEIEENERFEGLTHEEIVEKKDAERAKELKGLQDNAGKLLQSLRNPEPEIIDEDPDDDDLDEELDDDDNNLDEESDDEDSDPDNEDQGDESENENPDIPAVLPVTTEQSQIQPSSPEELTVKQLTTLFNKETKVLAKLDVESVEFKEKQNELSALQARINQILVTT